MRNPRQTWIIGTVIVAVLVLLAGWFLLVQPKRTEAAELDTQAQSVESSNVALAAKVATLRKQFEQIDDFKAELAALRLRLPYDGSVPELLDEIDTLAEESEVVLTAVNVGQPEEIGTLSGDRKKEAESVTDTLKGSSDKDDEAKDAEKPADGAASESTGEADAPAAPTKPKTPEASEKLVAFPTTLTIYGTFNEVSDYLAAIQTGISRYFLVSNVEATSLSAKEVFGRELEDGDVEYVITGAFYVYTDKDALLDEPLEEGQTEITLPERGADDNPFSRELTPGES